MAQVEALRHGLTVIFLSEISYVQYKIIIVTPKPLFWERDLYCSKHRLCFKIVGHLENQYHDWKKHWTPVRFYTENIVESIHHKYLVFFVNNIPTTIIDNIVKTNWNNDNKVTLLLTFYEVARQVSLLLNVTKW